MSTIDPNLLSLPSPRIERLDALSIVGLAKQFTAESRAEIPLLWQRFSRWIGQVPHQVGNQTYGVIRNNNKGRGFYYLAGVQVDCESAVPEGLTSVRLEAHNYAVFAHPAAVSSLFDTMCAIYTQWVPTAPYELLDAACFEYYGPDFNPQSGLGQIEIWLPISMDNVSDFTRSL